MIDVASIELKAGIHFSPEEGMCVMELASLLAGEPFTDCPKCVCPVIANSLRRLNDVMNHEDRQTLKPYAARVIGTKAGRLIERQRLWMIFDWTVREYAPLWFDSAGFPDQAYSLRSLPVITDAKAAHQSKRERIAACDAPRQYHGGSGDGAARFCVSDAAWLASCDSSSDFARVIGEARHSTTFRPTVIAALQSAFRLLDRLIEVSPKKG